MKRLTLFAALALPALAQQSRILTLREAEETALRVHPRIREAQQQIAAAGIQVEQTRSAWMPVFNGQVTVAGAEPQTRLGAGNLQDSSLSSRGAAGVSLNQLITDFGRTSRLTESRRSEVKSQEENLVFQRAQVILGVRENYYQTLLAQAVLKAAENNLNIRKLTLRQIRKLAESNLKSSLDVSFAEVNESQAELLVVQAENNIGAAMSRLSAAMGASAFERYTLTAGDPPSPPESDAAPMIRKALDSRPDLASLKLRGKSLTQFAGSEARGRWPSLSVTGATGLIPFGEKRLPSTYGGIGLNVNVPVLNGNIWTLRQKEQLARAQAVSEQGRDLEVRIANSVRIAWLNTLTAWKRVSVTKTLLEQSQRSLRLAQTRYDLGLGTIVELGQAQANQTAAEIESSAASFQYQVEMTRLQFEAGDLH